MGVFSLLFGNNETKREFNLDFELFKFLGKEEYDKLKNEESAKKQRFHDDFFVVDLKRIAGKKFLDWIHSSPFHISLTDKRGLNWIEYNKEVARFKSNKDIDDYINKEFKRLVKEEVVKTEYPIWFDEEYKELSNKDLYFCSEGYKWMNAAERVLVDRKYKK